MRTKTGDPGDRRGAATAPRAENSQCGLQCRVAVTGIQLARAQSDNVFLACSAENGGHYCKRSGHRSRQKSVRAGVRDSVGAEPRAEPQKAARDA